MRTRKNKQHCDPLLQGDNTDGFRAKCLRKMCNTPPSFISRALTANLRTTNIMDFRV